MPSYHYQARVPLVWYILSDTVRWYYWYGISYIYQVSIAHHLRNIRVQRSVRAERLGAKEVAATAAALMASLDNRRALLDAEAAQPRVICCCCHCCSTRDIRALWLTFFMNTFFTICQLSGSLMSHSQALLADTQTMFVDSGTYAINIFAELLKVRGAPRRTAAAVDLFAASVSVIALAVVAGLDLWSSIQRLIAGTCDDDIKAPIVFGFTVGNLVIDISMLGSILLRKRGGWKGMLMCLCGHSGARRTFLGRAKTYVTDVANTSRTECGSSTPPGINAMGAAYAQGEGGEEELVVETATGELNVFSALAHVLADTMRTVTEMTMSLIIWGDKDENLKCRIDAGSAIVVGVIILSIGAYIAYETIVQFREELKTRRKEDEEASRAAVTVQPLGREGNHNLTERT